MRWLRRLLGVHVPMRPGDSWPTQDGGTLTYLGKAPDPWVARVCQICKGPATQYKTTPPWPGSSYSHTAMTCDAHASYLDGVGWSSNGAGEWSESTYTSSCATCGGPYGECSHTAKYRVMMDMQEAQAVRGRVPQA